MDPNLSIVVSLGAFFIWALLIYNRLAAHRKRVANELAQIEVHLKRRHELIPDLVETARGYLTQDGETLKAVIRAVDSAQAAGKTASRGPGDAAAMADMAKTEGVLSSSLNRLLALTEAHPELKADRKMMQLSEEIITTENKLSLARLAYNDEVMSLNKALEAFPAVMFASTLGFRPATPLAPLDSDIER